MSCKITYTNDKITGVKDQSGNDSKLFRQIVSNPHLSAEESVEIYKNVYSKKITRPDKNDNNGVTKSSLEAELNKLINLPSTPTVEKDEYGRITKGKVHLYHSTNGVENLNNIKEEGINFDKQKAVEGIFFSKLGSPYRQHDSFVVIEVDINEVPWNQRSEGQEVALSQLDNYEIIAYSELSPNEIKSVEHLKKILNRSGVEETLKAIESYNKYEKGSTLANKFNDLLQTNKSAETQEFFSDVVTGKSSKFKPKKPWVAMLPLTSAQEVFKKIYDKFKGKFDEHIATSIPTFRETQIKVGNAVRKMLSPQPTGKTQELVNIKDKFLKSKNLPVKAPVYTKIDNNLFEEMVQFHKDAIDDRQNPEMLESYRAFFNETREQYEALVAAGYKIEPWMGKGEPYGVDSNAVREDVLNNKHLYYLRSKSATGENNEGELTAENYIPFESSGITINGDDVLLNDLFRAVHDIFGHVMVHNTFSPQGEYNAYKTHSVMYSEKAQKALFMETVVNNAWYFVEDNYAPRKIYDIPQRFIDKVNERPLVYDIGGSEGGFVKAITEASKGNIKTINLDPNPDMAAAHNKTSVEGSEVVQEAFYESFDGYKKHIPEQKADVVHESMTFQFISDKRAGFVKEIADNYLKEDGIFITEEKLLPESQDEWVRNELEKDAYKLKYYSQDQLTTKNEEVLVGMKKNQTKLDSYVKELKKNFKYVETYWSSGNFKGIVATNSEQKLNDFLNALGGNIVYSVGELDKITPLEENNDITAENSSNFANMTEDNDGNFVFYHYSPQKLNEIYSYKYGTNPKRITNPREVAAIGYVGGVSMYYTKIEDVETNVGNNGHLVKISKDKVYDFNRDSLNLIQEAKQQFEKEHPDKPFSPNVQLAYVTKIANAKGFDMVVATWGNKTRAQTAKPLKPTDTETRNGNLITKSFKEKYVSNKQLGYRPVVVKTKQEQLKDFYARDLYKYKNNKGQYDELYHMYNEYESYTQDQITDMIMSSDINQDLKDKYNEILEAQEQRDYSKVTNEISEPQLVYETPDGMETTSFQTAIQNTNSGDIKAKIDGNTIFTVDSSLDNNTFNGAINSLVKSGILSGESILDTNGDKILKTNGNSDIKKIINSTIAKDLLQKISGRKAVIETLDGNIKAENKEGKVTLKDSDGNDVDVDISFLNYADFEQLKKEFPDNYMDVLASQVYQDLFKGTSNEQELEEIEFTPENEIQQALINLLNKMGVKITSITDYISKFAKKNGVEPSANALADIANRIIAFNNGEIDVTQLTEEVAHFIVEGWSEAEIENILRNIDRTEEWQEHAANYFRIYREQNPNATEEEIDKLVRKEILGKVLANTLARNFNNSGKTDTQRSIIDRVIELFNQFMEFIGLKTSDAHIKELNDWMAKVEANLLADELYDMLSQEQLDSSKFVMYSASMKPDDILTQIEVRTQKSLDLLESQANKLRNSESKSELKQYRALIEKYDETSKKRAVAGVVSIAKRHTNYLKKVLNKNTKENYPFTQEENAVYITTVGEILGYLNEIGELLDVKDTTDKLIKEELDQTVAEIGSIAGKKGVIQNNAWRAMVERVAVKLSLTEDQKQELLDAYISRTDEEGNAVGGQLRKDTNWFFAHISSMVQAQDPALNMASDIISRMTTTSTIKSNQRIKKLLNRLEELGVSPKLLNKFKRGSYLFSSVNWGKLDDEVLEEKVRLYEEIKGIKLTKEEFEEKEREGELELNAEEKLDFYEAINEYRAENHRVDYLTKEAREARNKMYEGLSKDAIRLDKSISRERGQIGQEAAKLNGYTQEHKYRLQQLNKKRQRAKNPFDVLGRLLTGLMLDSEGNIIKDPSVKTLDRDAQTILDLIELDKRKLDFYRSKNKDNKEIPDAFIQRLEQFGWNIGDMNEFFFLNAALSFSNDFWDSLGQNNTFLDKLEPMSSEPEVKEIIDKIRKLQYRRSAILRANKVHNLPSEVDYENMNGSEITEVRDITDKLQELYSDAKAFLNEESQEIEDEKVFSTQVNKAYLNERDDRGAYSNEEEFEFIKEHVSKKDVLSLEKARGIAEDIIAGKRAKVSRFYESIFSMDYVGTEEEIRTQVYGELVEFSKTKLLPYFRRIEPIMEVKSFSEIINDLESENKSAVEFVEEIKEGKYPFLSLTPNYIFYSEETNEDLNPEYEENERLGKPQIQKQYRNDEYFEYFGIDENDQPTKNVKEYEALEAIIEYHEESLEATGMTDRHNKYLLPQMGMRGARQFQKLFTKLDGGTLKEVIKDMTSYREDEKQYGESVKGIALGNKQGDMRIPKYGFTKLSNQNDITDELLMAYAWMGNEAEIYSARLNAFADMEALKSIITNEDYGGKAAEASNTYKMFENFYKYNIYGQNENFSYETDLFGLLPKKVNLAPLAKKFQFWIRLVNLGFNLIVPLTSLFQGGANLMIEKFVAERVDKDASKMARKILPKYITEAVGDSLEFNSKSKLNSVAEFFGVFDLERRFKDSNYGKVTRGILKTGFLTHTIADAPIKGQVLLTVLHDMRVVGGDVLNFQQYRAQRKYEAKAKGETIEEKKIRSDWSAYEDKVLFNYISTNNGITTIEKEKLANDLGMDVESNEFKNFLDLKIQFTRDTMTRTAQEIDTMIPFEERSYGQRHAIFSFFFLHRGWLTVAYNRKLKGRHINMHTGLTEEGNWYGTTNFVKDWINEVRNPKNKANFFRTARELWHKADDTTKRSLNRTFIEIGMTNGLAAAALLMMAFADDQEDDAWLAQFNSYMGYRVTNEVISSTTAFPRQIFDALESPIIGMEKLAAVWEIGDLFSGDIVERGKYTDETERMRFLYKNLPAFKEYYNVVNAKKTRDTYEFYNRNNYYFAPVASLLINQDKDE